ncbi:DUF429 domain-containing protein [Ornithinimicrobium avium]|nr:DUF429 domain-containing protein [Ornithinimicrobium avium]
MDLRQWWRRVTAGRASATAAGRTGQDRPHAHQGRARSTGRSAKVSERAQPTGRPGRRAPVEESLPVMGVDACRGGWVGAVLDASGHGTPLVLVAATVAELVAAAGPVAVVGVDIPVGLPDGTRREADVQTRRFVGPRSSSVFTTPVRQAVYADSFGQANALNRERIGAGVSQQAWALRTRIAEVDAWLRQDLPFVVVEVHPEASFAQMAGAPAATSKRSAQGAAERRQVLTRSGVAPPGTLPVGVGVDDLLDACAAAWTAHRVKTGAGRTFPETPETFSDGLPAAIHV